jgi:membrane fusion protein, multidrug efflux system
MTNELYHDISSAATETTNSPSPATNGSASEALDKTVDNTGGNQFTTNDANGRRHSNGAAVTADRPQAPAAEDAGARDFGEQPGDQHHTEQKTAESPPEKGGQLVHLPQPVAKKAIPRRRVALAALAITGLIGIGVATTYGIRSAPPKSEKADRKGRNQIIPVAVAKVSTKTVPIQVSSIGKVQSEATVAVTPQAGGRITKVLFKKGDVVRKGQLLFTLDNRTQAAGIQQAQGVVSKDQAQVQQARANLEKDQGLVRQAQATLEKDQGLVQQARATLEKDKGLIIQAQATIEKDQGLIRQAQATLEKDRGVVRQAQATLAKDLAQAQFAKAQSDRYQSLYKQGVITQDQVQQFAASSAAQAATVQADREAIANAQAQVRSDEIAINNAQSVLKGDMAAIANARTSLQSDEIAITNAQAVVKGDLAAIANAQAVVKGDQAAIANAQAVVGADSGALNNAQVQASYTQVLSPIDGKAGNILVPEGNVVQANSNVPLVVIQKINPIQVSFAVPETNLAEIQRSTQGGKLKVAVNFTGSTKPIPGLLSFVNNTVDNSTGTIQLIGDFDNTDGQLFPGQFVNATLTLREEPNATVVPAQAVQNGANGQFVFIVKPDSTVENVPVTASLSVDGFNVIQKGSVKPGDQVVIDGQANLVSGSKIQVKDPKAPAGESGDSRDPSADGGDRTAGKSGRSRRNRGAAAPGASAAPDQPSTAPAASQTPSSGNKDKSR